MNFEGELYCHFIGIRIWECCIAYLVIIIIIIGTRKAVLRFGLALRERQVRERYL